MKTHGGGDVWIRVFLTSALVGGEWSDSRLGRFAPGSRAPGTHWIGNWVSPGSGMDVVKGRKALPLPGGVLSHSRQECTNGRRIVEHKLESRRNRHFTRMFSVRILLSISVLTIYSYWRYFCTPMTVGARSKVWTVFARSNARIVGSILPQVVDVSVCLFCVCVVLCAGSGLATG
jgi:hypothetical protein